MRHKGLANMRSRPALLLTPILTLLLMLAVAPALIGAQPRMWSAYYTEFYGADGTFSGPGQVIFLNRGVPVDLVNVPPSFYPAGYRTTPDLSLSTGLTDLAISADGRYLAGVFISPETGTIVSMPIADLTLGSCCVSLVTPVAAPVAVELGQFDPDSGRLAYTYVALSSDPAVYSVGGMATFDPATASIVQSIDMTIAGAAIGSSFASWAILGDWVSGQVQFADNCYACEGRFEGEWHLWNPATNAITVSSGVFFSNFFGDLLPSTGEMLYLVQNSYLPVSPEGGMLHVPNAVGYTPDGSIPPFDLFDTVPVVFHDAAYDHLSEARWIQNGASFVVIPAASDDWYIVGRDGSVFVQGGMTGARFLNGTSDGFMAALPAGSLFTLQTFQPVPGGWTASSLATGQLTGMYRYEGFWPLRTSPLTGVAFPPPVYLPIDATTSLIEPPLSPSVVCEGFTPLLRPGMIAQVTPGDPNRLRDAPTISGRILGQIPAGAQFTVIAGPYCAESYGWWFVEYAGITGFTVEGTGSTYFVSAVSGG